MLAARFLLIKVKFLAGDGVSQNSVWKRVLGLNRAVLQDIELETVQHADGRVEQVVVAAVRPHQAESRRCPHCRARCPGYDAGEGPRRWRGLDLGTQRVFLQADAPRVRCRAHGVVVAAVPWAEHDSRVTRAFADQTAWLAAHVSRQVVATLMRVTWKTVTSIVHRTVTRLRGQADRLDGLVRIGIDEVSYRKGHRYLLRVTDADTGRQVWAGHGACKDTLHRFFTALGPQRAKQLVAVAADGAEWIHDVTQQHAPQAAVCLDPFHVISWANEAVTELRRTMASQLRADGRTNDADALKGTRWALLHDPQNLDADGRGLIRKLARDNDTLYKAYMVKEQLRDIIKRGTLAAEQRLMPGILAWCSRSRSQPMVELGRRLRRFRPLIRNALHHRLSNAQAEAGNNHLRLLTRRAYGFASPDTLIAMSELTLGGLKPPLPGRT